MSIPTKTGPSFEQQVSEALTRSAQLAREEAIKHGTSIVVEVDGKIVEISAAELKKQAEQKKKNEA